MDMNMPNMSSNMGMYYNMPPYPNDNYMPGPYYQPNHGGHSGGFENQLVAGFNNMNLGVNSMMLKKPNNRGNHNSRGFRHGPNRPPPEMRREGGSGDPNSTSGRELAKQCNSDLKDCNPEDFIVPEFARFFVIKSYSEDDVHKSIKYGIWASTKNGNEKLMSAWNEVNDKWPTYLFFSVNASGQFLGMAKMQCGVDVNKKFNAWAQENKWYGQFGVKWTFLKDIPNKEFRHITLENNDGKPVTNSRDCQEVPLLQGRQMCEIFKNYKSATTIMDDFG